MYSLKTPLGRLKWTAIIEGVSYLLIGITMYLKYQMDMPKPNKVVGMIHGIFFILYILLVLMNKFEYNWKWGKTLLALFLSIIPFGTFWADKKLFV